MKKFLLTISILMLTAQFGHAQTKAYHPFPDSAMWRVDYDMHNPFQMPCFIQYYFQYKTLGDTVINSMVCKKVYRSYVETDTVSCVSQPFIPDAPTPGYVGALKDDPAANKVFFIYPGSTVDSLLYDYNLLVGDTLTGIISHNPIPFITYDSHPEVLSIDSVLINGQYRKRWNFDQTISERVPYIIQGIGTNFGLIESIYTYHLDFTDRYLVCMKDGSSIIFVSGYNSTASCEWLPTGIDEINIKSNISLHPNPFNTLTTLTSNVNLVNATLTVFNSKGQSVLVMRGIRGREVIIYRELLTEGMYFIRLTDGTELIGSKKLLLVD